MVLKTSLQNLLRQARSRLESARSDKSTEDETTKPKRAAKKRKLAAGETAPEGDKDSRNDGDSGSDDDNYGEPKFEEGTLVSKVFFKDKAKTTKERYKGKVKSRRREFGTYIYLVEYEDNISLSVSENPPSGPTKTGIFESVSVSVHTVP